MYLRTLCVLAVLAFSVTAAADCCCTVEISDNSYIDTSQTSGALELVAEMQGPWSPFDLCVGESHTFLFALVRTTEAWVNDDDLATVPVTAYMYFLQPAAVTGEVGGESYGFSEHLWIFSAYWQGWNLTWNDPVSVTAGEYVFSIDLSDAGYVSGVWQGPNGSGCYPGYGEVWATITLDECNPVPEPATVALLGIGLAGVALRRMRRR